MTLAEVTQQVAAPPQSRQTSDKAAASPSTIFAPLSELPPAEYMSRDLPQRQHRFFQKTIYPLA
jgi:hypothetical protein